MIRTCQTIIALFLTLLLCGPVEAQHVGPYLGAFIGGNALAKAKGSDVAGDFGLTFDRALQGSALLGWDLAPDNSVGKGRIELEYTRRTNQIDTVKFVEGNFKGGGNATSDSLMLNVYGVDHENSRLSPYIGVGIGASRIKVADLQVTGVTISNDSNVVFAYQVGVGIDVAVTDYLNIDIGYRFFSSSKPKFTEVNGQKFEMDYASHSAVLGVRVGF